MTPVFPVSLLDAILIFMPKPDRNLLMLRCFDRYLLKEVLQAWIAISFLLWIILLVSRFTRYLGEAVSGNLAGNTIFVLLGLKTLIFLVYILPFTLSLGVMLALGRLYRDREIPAYAAAGAGPVDLFRPLVSLALLVSLVLGWMALFLIPDTAAVRYQIRDRAENTTDITLLGAGRFHQIRSGQVTIFAEKVSEDHGSMEQLFIHDRQKSADGYRSRVLVADRASIVTDELSGDRFVILSDGHRYEGIPGKSDYQVMEFEKHGIRVDVPVGMKTGVKADAIPTAELIVSDSPEHQAELQWRLSVPLITINLMLLAIPLCRFTATHGRYGQLVFSLLLFIVYYNLLAIARTWVEHGVLQSYIGVWWVHAIVLLLAILLQNRDRIVCRIPS